LIHAGANFRLIRNCSQKAKATQTTSCFKAPGLLSQGEEFAAFRKEIRSSPLYPSAWQSRIYQNNTHILGAGAASEH
jgi:hypothetical protein